MIRYQHYIHMTGLYSITVYSHRQQIKSLLWITKHTRYPPPRCDRFLFSINIAGVTGLYLALYYRCDRFIFSIAKHYLDILRSYLSPGLYLA